MKVIPRTSPKSSPSSLDTKSHPANIEAADQYLSTQYPNNNPANQQQKANKEKRMI